MAAIVVVEDHELALIKRAIEQYKSTIFHEDDLDNDYALCLKLLDRFKKTSSQKYNGGKAL